MSRRWLLWLLWLIWLLCVAALAACSGGPGRTPIEQAPLAKIEDTVPGEPLISMEQPVPELQDLVLVVEEFSKMPMEVAVVWQSPSPPPTDWLSQVPGKRVRQYWDPQRKTPSTGGRLRVNGKLVLLERLALRVALAQYSAKPN